MMLQYLLILFQTTPPPHAPESAHLLLQERETERKEGRLLSQVPILAVLLLPMDD